MARFAADTSVSVERSRAEIEGLIIRYGATHTAFMSAPGRAVICFEAKAPSARSMAEKAKRSTSKRTPGAWDERTAISF